MAETRLSSFDCLAKVCLVKTYILICGAEPVIDSLRVDADISKAAKSAIVSQEPRFTDKSPFATVLIDDGQSLSDLLGRDSVRILVWVDADLSAKFSKQRFAWLAIGQKEGPFVEREMLQIFVSWSFLAFPSVIGTSLLDVRVSVTSPVF